MSAGCGTLCCNTLTHHHLKSPFSSTDEYVTFPSCRMRWLADCLTPAASWLPLYSFSFFFFLHNMLFTIQPRWEQFSELLERKKKPRLFSALAFRLSSRLGLAERESKQFDLSGRVAPSPLRAFQKEKKKDNEWEWHFNSNSCIETFPSIYAIQWSVSNVLLYGHKICAFMTLWFLDILAHSG